MVIFGKDLQQIPLDQENQGNNIFLIPQHSNPQPCNKKNKEMNKNKNHFAPKITKDKNTKMKM